MSNSRSPCGIAWLRRDLRLADHPALQAALDEHEQVTVCFVIDDAITGGRHASGPRTQFMLECLAELRSGLRERGSDLIVRHGDPARELAALAAVTAATTVHFTTDVTPYARRRGELVRSALAKLDVEMRGHPGLCAVDHIGEVRTQKDGPYTVFSPFHRNWLGQPRRAVLPPPERMPPLPAGLELGPIPALGQLGLAQEVTEPAPGGEAAAHTVFERFLDGAVHEYADNHNALGHDRTSRLSPYLRFGCISPRQVEEALPAGEGPAAFRRQLCWRDFYCHVLLHHPANATQEFQERYRGTIPWNKSIEDFEAWCRGRTGFPLVDAGMRQLRREGWMHNRARLVVGSFLTKDLGIDWRRGEEWFMRLLLDGDEPNNNGNWQWIASVGTDPQPVARRIFNPTLQMERHDPSGEYVRRYVPELHDVPDEHLAEPWRMSADDQRACGCEIGRDYPAPIVDHAAARAAALERYRAS